MSVRGGEAGREYGNKVSKPRNTSRFSDSTIQREHALNTLTVTLIPSKSSSISQSGATESGAFARVLCARQMTALDSAKLDDARKAGDRLRFGATVTATEVTGVGFNYN